MDKPKPPRIIAGAARGRRLRVPDVEGLRPTSGRVREALFSMLWNAVADARVADLFAGCGALGLEALSRGAACCTFVDREPKAVRVLRDNLTRIGWESRGRVVAADVLAAADALRGECYDVVLLDPPYGAGLLREALATLESGALCAGGAQVLAVHERALTPEAPPGWEVLTRRTYGSSGVTWFVAPGP